MNPPNVRPAKMRVELDVPADIATRYEQGASVLRDELSVEGISARLLMLVCLAAPQVDDLVLGFIRDDLQVVSLDDQTRRIVQRDLQLIAGRASSAALTPGALARQIQQLAQQGGPAVRGDPTPLDDFIAAHADVFRAVAALKPTELARWVFLGLMREMEGRARGRAVIHDWLQSLQPEDQLRVESHRQSLAGASTSRRSARVGR